MTQKLCPHEKCQRNRRVIIIDNDSDYRSDLMQLLEVWGCEAIAAEGTGLGLIKDAIRKTREHCCRLILLDMRLCDNDDPRDMLGLYLAERLRPASSIIITGYGSLETARDALQIHDAATIVGKEEGPKALRRAIVNTFGETCLENIKIKWPHGWSSKKVSTELLLEENALRYLDEADWLLAQLFPGMKEISLERLSGATETPSPDDDDRHRRSAVFLVQRSNKSPQIIKFMRVDKVRRERENYEKYVDGQVGGNRYAQLQNYKEGWAVGAIVYSFIGGKDELHAGSLQTFSKFYTERQDTHEILSPLEKFFELWWARRRTEPMQGSLYDSYKTLWKDRVNNASIGWEQYNPSSNYPLGISFKNPLDWAERMYDFSSVPDSNQLSQAVIHGDLHGDNLIVDNSGLPWVIDFGRTGCGHALRDFVELAQYIITRLVHLEDSSRESVIRLYELIVAFVTPLKPGAHMKITANIKDHPETEKAFYVLAGLRRLALETTAYSDSRELLWGLLLESLFVSAVLRGEQERRPKLLLLASIICQRLDRWGREDWLPADWPAVTQVKDGD